MSITSPTTFEEKFGAHIPPETRVSMKSDTEEVPLKAHVSVGIVIKVLAYLIDIGMAILILPIPYNIYRYLKRGQSIGQRAIGARIYRSQTLGQIASIRQLMMRFVIKFVFLCTWAIIGVNLVALLFDGVGYDTQYNVAYGILYTLVMIAWIHGYALTMFSSTRSRGMHDVFAGTIVAYDHPYSAKKIIISLIFCSVLYYGILWFGPMIINRVSYYVSSQLGHGYRAVRTWIDTWIVNGLRQANL